MTQIDAGWGAGPSASYETLAATFRPVFRQIARWRVGCPMKSSHC